MSRDIRSYFTLPTTKADGPKPKKPNKRRIILSSDEEDSSDSHPVVHKQKGNKTSQSPKKRQKTPESDEKTSRKRPQSKSKSPAKKKQEELKPAVPGSIFDKTPVKRVNAPPIIKKLKEEEALIHDDDEFEATLCQIDTEELELMQEVTTAKRKKIDSDEKSEETPTKKPKLDKKSNKTSPKTDNNDSKDKSSPKESKEHGSNGCEVKKSKSNDEKKQSKASSKAPAIEVVVEKKPLEKNKSQKEKTADPFEEIIAKKKEHAAAYQKYLHRGGARNPGSKEVPTGASNCLAGLTFVITGVLDSLEREEADSLIKKYGGRVVVALSKKSNYLVAGDEAGQSKLTKAQQLNIKIISEDDLLDLIRTKPPKKSPDIEHSRTKKKSPEKHVKNIPKDKPLTPPKADEPTTHESKKDQSPTKTSRSPKKISTVPKPEIQEKKSVPPNNGLAAVASGETTALVEKYRPKLLKQIIGQQGDKSPAKKFHFWLSNWQKNHSGKKAKVAKPSPWAKNDDGAFYKACLLSGPPGVGKTTTVQVVCAELGFDLLEFNASDTRSKKLLKEEVAGILSNTTVKGYFTDKEAKTTSIKHVLVMDEVDGMAGNEDRGGLQELLALVKTTDIPIICICNDRANPKMRSLSNYTFDLRFPKPKLEQIRGAMKSLCCRENISINNEDLDRLIQSTNNDIRQVINHLAMLGAGSSRKDGVSPKLNKDLKLGPWDVARKVFSAEEHTNMSIHDKSDLFFHDYNIAGLFVQENYPLVAPSAPKEQLLQRLAAAADSLSMSNLVEDAIRGNGAWSLLPMQACYASVIPGSLMSGVIRGQIAFPSWLGRNSKRAKFDRLLQEITVHTRLITGASKEAINIEYLKPLRDAVTRPLTENGSNGVEAAVAIMNHYHLLRDDLDALVEVSLWPGQQDPMQAIESKVKAAFTRAYNKNCAMTPFTMGAAASKKKTAAPSQDEGFIDDDENIESEGEEDDVDTDRMLKAKKPAASKAVTGKASATKATASTSRGQGKPAAKRGRGRGK